MPFEKIRPPKCRKTLKTKKSNSGIKATVSCSVLYHILTAAKRWYAFSKISDGDEAAERSSLAKSIPIAEAILKKFDQRNRLAYEELERRRHREFDAQVREHQQKLIGELAQMEDETTEFVPQTIGDAIEQNKDRPTRW